MIKVYLFFALAFVPLAIKAQSISSGSSFLDEYYRNQQLLGNVDSTISFMVRPLNKKSLLNFEDIYNPQNSEDTGVRLFDRSGDKQSNKGLYVRLMPVSLTQQYNSKHPYGWNDGAMIAARGYQTMVTAGVFLQYKFLSIQLQPELVYAANKSFDGFLSAGHTANVIRSYTDYVSNRIDLPERFGDEAYSKLFPGQSSIRLTFGPVSVGISSENLWWGPGKMNSLLMSNNAPGFMHVTLNTVRPIHTPIGSFEGQIIGARLDTSAFLPLQNSSYKAVKPNDWRYLSGGIFTYQPKWVTGVFIGFGRVFNNYGKDVIKFRDYMPLFSALEKKNLDNVKEDAKSQDQYTTFFTRWVLQQSHAELYFEYGRNDHPYNLRDLELEPEHSRAYIMGFQKFFTLTKTGNLLQFAAEATQLENSKTIFMRPGPVWYAHHLVTQGYTNQGQIIGAGIGTGSDSQSLELNWLNGLKKIGLQLDRLVHNNDFQYDVFSDLRRPWVDLVVGGDMQWDYKQLVIGGKLKWIHSVNYQWQRNVPDSPNSDLWFLPGVDSNSFHVNVKVSYQF